MPTSNTSMELGNTTMMWGNGYFKNVISAGDIEASYSSDENLKTDLKKMENLKVQNLINIST